MTSKKRARGAALMTALFVVALAALLVSGLLWRQHVQIRRLENQRLMMQARWVERSALDWIRLTLRALGAAASRSEEHTSELQSPDHLVCRLLLEKKKKKKSQEHYVPFCNLAASDAHFILHPEDYAAAEEAGEVVCIVHSHPNLPPLPSEA